MNERPANAGDIARAHRFGRDLLGPVVLRYLLDLDRVTRAFTEDGDGCALYTARAGIRIRRLHQAMLAARGLPEPRRVGWLWTSRFLTAKGAWRTHPLETLALLRREFAHESLATLLGALWGRGGWPPAPVDLSDPALNVSASRLDEFIWSQHPAAHVARWHLAEQSDLFTQMLQEATGGAARVLLIDSGWQGTIQRVLGPLLPGQEVWGAYFGRIASHNEPKPHWDKALGLVFEADAFDPARFETAFILHRHLIEDFLEPAGTSVEFLRPGPEGTVAVPAAEALLADDPVPERDPIYCGVEEYVRAPSCGYRPGQVHLAAEAALERIARVLAFPDRDMARALSLRPRSADFGRHLSAPVLLPAQQRRPSDSAETRIGEALWPQGQIALEYDEGVVVDRQRQSVGVRPAAIARPAPAVWPPRGEVPAVAVITRTMDRLPFLRRAMRSVAAQRFTDYVHVVVCDGGDIEGVRRVIEESPADLRRVRLVDNVRNRGMEAASNIAISASRSEFIVIHDDDDTWAPDFLRRTVDFMRSPAGGRYAGVVTHAWRISEEVTPDGIKEHSRTPFMDWVEMLRLSQMASENLYAPISFLFRRSAYEAIGPFDQALPVLGDWDFNLRMLAHADIAVIKEKLAFYHHRDVGHRGLYANSVSGGRNLHAEYDAVVRNKFLRAAPGTIEARVGMLMGVGLGNATVLHSVERVASGVDEVGRRVQGRTPRRRRDDVVLSRLADDRWLALNHMAAALKREGEKRVALEAEIGRLRAFNDVLQKEADDRWLALVRMTALHPRVSTEDLV